ncbi:glycosyltransferase family 2 protein [Turicibacter sanguinis]|uniref:glycosyltransferase family 2 protein n=1 Tax=Turicibacter sanguinis TaxID=154288 RepID=UPI00232B790B|nr:glycosyltransferase [Turicibacter sanguinis]MDB8460328.1 glycosyltransferase [Turicibacter sanguinis]
MESLVSIIMPSYNSEKFISDSIQSIINQTYKNFELIIVDDCSKDNTKKIIKKYIECDSRIKFIALEKNYGAANARNFAIEKARGRYIAFLDSDDLWDNRKLEIQIKFMNMYSIGFSYTNYRIISENNNLLKHSLNIPDKISYSELLGNTVIGCLTVIIDREIIGDFRMIPIRKGQDTATWLSILKKEHIAHGLDQVLSSYRRVDGSLSSNKIKEIRKMWIIYRQIEQLNILVSLKYLSKYSWNAILKRII